MESGPEQHHRAGAQPQHREAVRTQRGHQLLQDVAVVSPQVVVHVPESGEEGRAGGLDENMCLGSPRHSPWRNLWTPGTLCSEINRTFTLACQANVYFNQTTNDPMEQE